MSLHSDGAYQRNEPEQVRAFQYVGSVHAPVMLVFLVKCKKMLTSKIVLPSLPFAVRRCRYTVCGPLAQLVEQLTLNQLVRGSSP